jgi:hypothetical protein
MVHEKLVSIKTNEFSYEIRFFSLDGIVATMKSKAGPAYRVLETLAEYEKFLSHNDYSIIGMFVK